MQEGPIGNHLLVAVEEAVEPGAKNLEAREPRNAKIEPAGAPGAKTIGGTGQETPGAKNLEAGEPGDARIEPAQTPGA